VKAPVLLAFLLQVHSARAFRRDGARGCSRPTKIQARVVSIGRESLWLSTSGKVAWHVCGTLVAPGPRRTSVGRAQSRLHTTGFLWGCLQS
jgi:hypothetical protein